MENGELLTQISGPLGQQNAAYQTIPVFYRQTDGHKLLNNDRALLFTA